jgi:uncharacterized protein (TIGR03067 family)
MRRFTIILVLSLLAASCGDDNGGPSLAGDWTGTEVGGDTAAWTFVFDATALSAASAGTEVYEGTYIAHPDENPMRLEFAVAESVFSPFVGETALAIYRFDGDTLILASNEPGVAETPTGFTPGGGTRVWELSNE